MTVTTGKSIKGGSGLFAADGLTAGGVIRRVEINREITDAQPLDRSAGESADHCTVINGRTFLVAPPDRYVNHSCDPNAYYVFDAVGSVLVARRSIHAGEEICVDYLVNNAGGDSWPCNCGAARCRGNTGTSFFALPKAIRKEYRPLLADWFKARHGQRLLDLDWS